MLGGGGVSQQGVLFGLWLGVCGGVTYAWATGNARVQRTLSRNAVLSSSRVRAGRWWTLVTHSFSHRDLAHLGVNAFTLYSFGSSSSLATRPLAALYFASALGGGVAHVAASELVPRSRLPAAAWARRDDAALGASGAVAGIVTRTLLLSPRSEVLLFFVVPVPSWAFVAAFVAWSTHAAFFSRERGSSLAHAGHLGGAAVGALAAGAVMARRGRGLRYG